jgi:hypothetical protein
MMVAVWTGGHLGSGDVFGGHCELIDWERAEKGTQNSST